MELHVGKLTSATTSSSWTQVHEFITETDQKKEKRGELVAVIAAILSTETVPKGDGGTSLKVGHELLTRLNEEYYGNLQDKAYPALSRAVKKAAEELGAANVSIIALTKIAGQVNCVVWGEGRVEILRGGERGVLLSGQKDHLKSISGVAQERDNFLIATTSLFSLIPDSEINKAFSVNPTEAVALLAPRVRSSPSNEQPIACAFIQVPVQSNEMVGKPMEAKKLLAKSKELKSALFVAFSFFNKQPKIEDPRFSHKSSKSLFTALLHPRLNIQFLAGFSQSLNKLRKRRIYLQESKPKRENLILGVTFLFIIIVGVFWGLQRRETSTRRSQYENILVEAQSSLTQSKELVELNSVRSRELARQARSLVEELVALNIEEDQVTVFISEANNTIPELLGEYIVSPTPLVDLGLVREGFTAGKIAGSEGNILVLDTTKRLLLSFTIEGENMKVRAGPDSLPQARLIAFWDDRAFVLDGQRIAEVEKGMSGTPVIARTLILPEGSWGKIVQMKAFGGNLYLVDSVKSQIWRYPGLVERVGSGQEWLADGIDTKFEDVVSMSIDGSIWLLRESGRVTKYTRGNPETFRISGLEKGFNDPTVLLTDSELENLYILDRGNARVVVLNKTGDYKAQYLWEEMREAAGIAVSEGRGKMLIFVGGKVYEVVLKN